MQSEIRNIFLSGQEALTLLFSFRSLLLMSDEIRLPRPEYATPPGVQHHFCEHAGCGKDAGWGQAEAGAAGL